MEEEIIENDEDVEKEEIIENGEDVEKILEEEFGTKIQLNDKTIDTSTPLQIKKVVATEVMPLDFETMTGVSDVTQTMSEFSEECVDEHGGVVDSIYDSGTLTLLCEAELTLDEIRKKTDDEEPATYLRAVKDMVVSFRNGSVASLQKKIDSIRDFSEYCIKEGGEVDVSSWKDRDLNTGEILAHDFILNCMVRLPVIKDKKGEEVLA